MSTDVKQSMTVLKRLKAASLEVVRRYHRAVPTFLDLYAGTPRRPGPIFAKEARCAPRPDATAHAGDDRRDRHWWRRVDVGVRRSPADERARAADQHRYQHLVHRTRPDAFEHARLEPAGDDHQRTIDRCGDDRARVLERATKIDMLFIDGDHSLDACRADFDGYREWLAPSGIVIFHDTAPFPAAAAPWVLSLPPDDGGTPPQWTADESGIYHRPDVARCVDQILAEYHDYSLLSLQTLVEPCCGMAILQRTQQAYRPKREPGLASRAHAGVEG